MMNYEINGYLCKVRKAKLHIKPITYLLILIILSVVSSLYMWSYYNSEILNQETISLIQDTNPIGLKEVGFTDFVMDAMRRVFILAL